MSTVSTPTKPATRTLRWHPNTDPVSPTAGLLTIETGKLPPASYIVTEFPTGHPARGFYLTRPLGSGYTVFCSTHGVEQDSCDCPDLFYRARRCKHILAVRKLIELGKL